MISGAQHLSVARSAFCYGQATGLERISEDWHIRVVTLNEVKGLAVRFLAALLRNKICDPDQLFMAARHSGRATRDPESRGENLDARLRGHDGQGCSLCVCPFAAGVILWTTRNDKAQWPHRQVYECFAFGFRARPCHSLRTANTGREVERRTASVTLPSRSRRTPLRPWVAITIRSTPRCSAVSRIVRTGAPS